MSLIDIVNYICNSIDVLVEIKSQEKIDQCIEEQTSECETNVYEPLLIKAENDVRSHIKVISIYLHLHSLIVGTRIKAAHRRTGNGTL